MNSFFYDDVFLTVKEECKVNKDANTEELEPKRKTQRSAGYDFHMPYDLILTPNERKLIFTDWKCKLPHSMVLMLFPRSSIAIKRGIILQNTVGVIDADYYGNEDNDGNIGVALINTSDKIQTLKKGEAFCQGIILQYFDEEKLYFEYAENKETINYQCDVNNLKENVKILNSSAEEIQIRKGGFGSTDDE